VAQSSRSGDPRAGGGAGYPDRILPVNERAAKELKKRTLTNLYNARPAWLDNVHRELDEAVAAAYGWPADLADDEILKRLLNLARAAANPSPRPSPDGRGRPRRLRGG
jgi:hypothetical protein